MTYMAEHLSPLVQPGPFRLAIHWASFSSCSLFSNLAATPWHLAAPLAAPEMADTRDKMHWACPHTTQVLTRRRYWATSPL